MTLNKAIIWSATGQFVLLIVQLAAQIIVTRLLTPSQMGVYAAGVASAGLIGVLQAFGLGSLIVRERELTSELRDTAFTINLMLCGLISLIMYLSSFALSAWLNSAGVARVLQVLAIVPLLGALELVPSASLQRSMEFRTIALITGGRAITNSAFTILLAALGASYMGLAWGTLIGAALSAALFNIFGRSHATFKIDFRAWRYVFNFGLQITAISGVSQLSARLSVLILGRVLGLSALGYYSRAENIISVLWDNIHGVLARVLLADLAERRRGGAGLLRETYLKMVAIITAILWPLFGGTAILAGPIVQLIYGAQWASVAGPLALLSISLMIVIANTLAWELFIICEETRTQSKIEFVRAAANLAMFTIGSFFGLIAASAARIADAIFSQILYFPHMMRMTDTRYSDLVPIYARNALLTFVATAPAFAMMSFFGWSNAAPLPAVLSSVALGFVFWGSALAYINHPIAAEVRRIWFRFGRPAIVLRYRSGDE